ncbi:hypothetical protein [Bacillus solitudinis]|uniref:hypothetical protein n=1 Tax=Bacillus solitudinis TaxID=2014074 RepID=UPI000C2410B4|nr:hypothetical protein [Bacillus solitudinis]
MERRSILVVLILAVALSALIFAGQWHWQNQIYQTNATASSKLQDYQFPLNHGYIRSERTVVDMKFDFSVGFEEAYAGYEIQMNQLLQEATQVYYKKVLNDEMSYHDLVNEYQSSAREAEKTFREQFWTEYIALQDEMEEAGYPRDDAFEFELEFELRVEQLSHAFVQELMMLGQRNIGTTLPSGE